MAEYRSYTFSYFLEFLFSLSSCSFCKNQIFVDVAIHFVWLQYFFLIFPFLRSTGGAFFGRIIINWRFSDYLCTILFSTFSFIHFDLHFSLPIESIDCISAIKVIIPSKESKCSTPSLDRHTPTFIQQLIIQINR